MIKCPECQKEFSDTAGNCPKCGYKLTPQTLAEIKAKKQQNQKNTAIGCGVVIGILILIAVIAQFCPEEKKEEKPLTPEEAREQKIGACFSGWDGSHRELEKLVKQSMNDPGSYEHVETRYSDKGDYLAVYMKFRGKNAFGGTVVNWVTANCDLNCNVLQITGQGP